MKTKITVDYKWLMSTLETALYCTHRVWVVNQKCVCLTFKDSLKKLAIEQKVVDNSHKPPLN